MGRVLFLASKRVGGLAHVLPRPPAELRTVFVPTAGVPFASAPWVDRRRAWFESAGFKLDELELSTAEVDQVAAALAAADLVYVEGGNTYFLLQHMQRCRFWEAMERSSAVYAGVSAGALVVCPDIGFIGELDDRDAAPELADTRGAALVDFSILPHLDDVRVKDQLAQIVAEWPDDQQLIGLDDDQALIVEAGFIRCVHSPDELANTS